MLKTVKLRHTLLHLQLSFIDHLFSWFSKEKGLRSRIRKGYAVSRVIDRYLTRYAPAMAVVKPSISVDQAVSERAFSIWFQGQNAAPDIVKACFRSVKHHFAGEFVVLDHKNLDNWIEPPGYIVDKWREGKIGAAHIADICRVELLYQYGGWWFDATDFLTSPTREI